MPGRRQQGEGSVYQRSRDKRWVAVADLGQHAGKRDRREFTGSTPKEAMDKRDRFMDRRRDGFTMPKGRPPYVSEWMLHWLHNVAKRKVEATTWEKSYRQKVTDLICPWFDRIPLHELTEEDVEDWHRHLEGTISKRTGRPLSASTIGQCHRIMSTALKLAVARGKLPRNPCANVTPPQPARRELVLPSAKDVDRILDCCETRAGGARWILALQAGLRQGEALELKWADVRLADPATVSVRRAAARISSDQADDGPAHRGRRRTSERIVKEPKSARGKRTVPLTPRLAAALRAHKQRQEVASLDGLVFTDSWGRPVHPRSDWRDWSDLLAELGLPRYRIHDCRHVLATQLLERGTDPRVVQDIMGWSTVAMTEVYQHVRPALMADAMDALDGRR